MSTPFNRDQFLARLKQKPGFKTKTVDVPDFGTVTLRQMDPALREEMRKLPRETPEELAMLGLATLAVSIIDPDTNEPMFSAAEASSVLMQMSPNQITLLLTELNELNEFNPVQIEKNSATSPNSDSVTASH